MYYLPAKDAIKISDKEIHRYDNARFNSFDTFKNVQFGIWCVCIPRNNDWKKSTCSCPEFLKNYMCKHIIGMSIRLKYCKPFPEAKNVEIGSKRKRGRPAKAKGALLVQ